MKNLAFQPTLKVLLMNSWEAIWNNRQPENGYDLVDLIKINGFDGGGTSFSTEAWLKYVTSFEKTIPIDPSDSIFEFGCGCGAFLLPFYEMGHVVGGIDYSETLIKIASTVMDKGDLAVKNAKDTFADTIYDLVLAHSVFQYFESLDFAKTVCCNMLQKSSKKVAILDVPNSLLQKESERDRSIVKAGYRAKDELLHLYYEKQWFEQFAIEEDVDIKIIDQSVDGYINSKYRFNVILTKL